MKKKLSVEGVAKNVAERTSDNYDRSKAPLNIAAQNAVETSEKGGTTGVTGAAIRFAEKTAPKRKKSVLA